tara:strand:+ start:300 stop:641 length:342 start_codon:yes stop_codon:yes gene_type:complete
MSFPAQIYNGATTTGGGCPCKTPPTPIDCTQAASRNVRVNGLAPVLMGDSMSPEVGVTCTSPPSGCTSPRTVIATGAIVKINGKLVARSNDVLNPSTNIRLTMATTSPNVFFS